MWVSASFERYSICLGDNIIILTRQENFICLVKRNLNVFHLLKDENQRQKDKYTVQYEVIYPFIQHYNFLL